jgi:hypothetical protein
MKREPVATIRTRQVRASANMLTKDDFLPSSFVCVDFRRQENRGFAQSSFFNVDSHDVVNEL